MLIRIDTAIYVEVADENEGEEAAHIINGHGHEVLGEGFPHGEILKTKVVNAAPVEAEEADEEGLTE